MGEVRGEPSRQEQLRDRVEIGQHSHRARRPGWMAGSGEPSPTERAWLLFAGWAINVAVVEYALRRRQRTTLHRPGRPALASRRSATDTEGMDAAVDRGHRLAPNIADLAIEAWGPTREACLGETVAGLVAGFADCGDVTSTTTVPVSFAPAADDELLVAVLKEVISLFDVLGSVVVTASLSATEDGGVAGFFEMAELAEVTEIGPSPKGVSSQGLSLRVDPDGWTARVTIDV